MNSQVFNPSPVHICSIRILGKIMRHLYVWINVVEDILVINYVCHYVSKSCLLPNELKRVKEITLKSSLPCFRKTHLNEIVINAEKIISLHPSYITLIVCQNVRERFFWQSDDPCRTMCIQTLPNVSVRCVLHVCSKNNNLKDLFEKQYRIHQSHLHLLCNMGHIFLVRRIETCIIDTIAYRLTYILEIHWA